MYNELNTKLLNCYMTSYNVSVMAVFCIICGRIE